jgi:hypothetical protein
MITAATTCSTLRTARFDKNLDDMHHSVCHREARRGSTPSKRPGRMNQGNLRSGRFWVIVDGDRGRRHHAGTFWARLHLCST